MVRTSQATTFSSSPYFFDRGAHGAAQPITERINVSLRLTESVQSIYSYDSPTLVLLYRIMHLKALVDTITE